MLELAQIRPLQQSLMNGDRLADLSLFPVQIPENHVDFERIGVEARRPGELFDRQIDLIAHEEVEAEDVMRRLPRAPSIDPLAVLQLVPLPRFPDREADEQGGQRRQEERVLAHGWPSFS